MIFNLISLVSTFSNVYCPAPNKGRGACAGIGNVFKTDMPEDLNNFQGSDWDEISHPGHKPPIGAPIRGQYYSGRVCKHN